MDGNGNPSIQFNADAGGNYYTQHIQAASAILSGALADAQTQVCLLSNHVAGTPSQIYARINNGSTLKKNVISYGGSRGKCGVFTSYWNSTNEITDILVFCLAANFKSGSTLQIKGYR